MKKIFFFDDTYIRNKITSQDYMADESPSNHRENGSTKMSCQKDMMDLKGFQMALGDYLMIWKPGLFEYLVSFWKMDIRQDCSLVPFSLFVNLRWTLGFLLS